MQYMRIAQVQSKEYWLDNLKKVDIFKKIELLYSCRNFKKLMVLLIIWLVWCPERFRLAWFFLYKY